MTLGLGVMGYPMAVNLRTKLDSDRKMFTCDVNKSALDRFQEEMEGKGPVQTLDSAYQVIQAAVCLAPMSPRLTDEHLPQDILITVLPSASAMGAVYLDSATGILPGIEADTSKRRKLVIECGTINSGTIKEIFEAASKLPNLQFVDAPISGGPMGSQAGTLSFMVGCPSDVFPPLKSELLDHMGKPESIFHCGQVGSGTAFKIINNYISLVSVLSVSEAYSIATKLGLDLKALTDVFNSGSAQCWVISNNNPVPGIHPHAPASNNYKGGFRVELALKDLGLGMELAEMAGVETTLNKATIGVFEKVAADERYKGKDSRVVYKYLVEKEKMD